MTLEFLALILIPIIIPIFGFVCKSLYMKVAANEQKLNDLNIILYKDFVSKSEITDLKKHFDHKIDEKIESVLKSIDSMKEIFDAKMRVNKHK
jgi:hypothetical protein